MCSTPRSTIITLCVISIISNVICALCTPQALLSAWGAVISLNTWILRAVASGNVKFLKLARFAAITLIVITCCMIIVVPVAIGAVVVIEEKHLDQDQEMIEDVSMSSEELKDMMNKISGLFMIFIEIVMIFGIGWEIWKYRVVTKIWRTAAHGPPPQQLATIPVVSGLPPPPGYLPPIQRQGFAPPQTFAHSPNQQISVV